MHDAKEQWPKTIEEAIDRLLMHVDDENKRHLMRGSYRAFRGKFVEDIIGEFGLMDGNQELLDSCIGSAAAWVLAHSAVEDILHQARCRLMDW